MKYIYIFVLGLLTTVDDLNGIEQHGSQSFPLISQNKQ